MYVLSHKPPLSFAILSEIPNCPTLACFSALTSTVQLGSPFSITWSSFRNHASNADSYRQSNIVFDLKTACMSLKGNISIQLLLRIIILFDTH